MTEHFGDSYVYVDRKKYGGKVNGVCGNCDGNPRNDWRYIVLLYLRKQHSSCKLLVVQ